MLVCISLYIYIYIYTQLYIYIYIYIYCCGSLQRIAEIRPARVSRSSPEWHNFSNAICLIGYSSKRGAVGGGCSGWGSII